MPIDPSWFITNPRAGTTIMNAFEQGQQQRKQEQAQNALTAYATNPNDETLKVVAQYDPQTAIQERSRMQAQLKAMSDEQRKLVDDRMKTVGEAALWADTPEKWDQAIDYLTQQGYQGIEQYKGKFSPQLRESAIASAGQWKSYLEQTAPVTVGPGSHLVDPVTGKPKFSAPFAPRPVTVGPGDTVVEYAPGAGGALTVDSLLPHIVAQESRGQYTARNPETGAMGAYQVMPATAQALAERVGMPWRPDLMASDTPQGRKYQDMIGRAAVQEAVDNSGGDVAAAAAYYHGGSDRSKWGPRTQKYAEEVSARFGGGKPRVIAQGEPKPTTGNAPSGYRFKSNGDLEPIPGGPAANGGMTKQQVGAVKTKIQDLRAIRGQIQRIKDAAAALESGGFSGPIWGNLPGAGSLDSESAKYDKAVAQLAPLIRKLTRTPGEGAMSDYESRLAEFSLPSRTENKAARDEAMAGFDELLTNIEAGYQELLGGAPAAAPTASKAPTKRRIYNPKTGELE